MGSVLFGARGGRRAKCCQKKKKKKLEKLANKPVAVALAGLSKGKSFKERAEGRAKEKGVACLVLKRNTLY